MVRAAQLSPEAFVKQIKKTPSRVYLFSGPDSRALDAALAELSKQLFGGEDPSLNLDTVHAGEITGQELAGRARTVPFFSGERLVIVRDCERFSGPDVDVLLSYIEDPCPSTTLVLVARQPDMRRKLFTGAAGSGVHVVFGEPGEKSVAGWIQQRAGELGVKMSAGAAAALVEAAGMDPNTLGSEMEKLALYAGRGNTIKSGDVAALVGVTRRRRIFELTDAVADRRPEEALKVLGGLLGPGGESPVGIVAMLAWQVRRLWIAKEAIAGGKSPGEAAKQAGVRPYFTRSFLEQVKRFTEDELERGFELLLEADLALKTSSGDQRVLLELLLCRLSS